MAPKCEIMNDFLFRLKFYRKKAVRAENHSSSYRTCDQSQFLEWISWYIFYWIEIETNGQRLQCVYAKRILYFICHLSEIDDVFINTVIFVFSLI